MRERLRRWWRSGPTPKRWERAIVISSWLYFLFAFPGRYIIETTTHTTADWFIFAMASPTAICWIGYACACRKEGSKIRWPYRNDQAPNS